MVDQEHFQPRPKDRAAMAVLLKLERMEQAPLVDLVEMEQQLQLQEGR